MQRYGSVIVGAGPAGCGPLVGAFRQGTAQQFLDTGVLWVDGASNMGAGNLGRWHIDSDTAAAAFIECVGPRSGPLAVLKQTAAAQHLAALGQGAVPLPVVSAFLHDLGSWLEAHLAASKTSHFLPNTRARKVIYRGPFDFEVHFATQPAVQTAHVLWAMGGYQDAEATYRASLRPGVSLDRVERSRVCSTGELFSAGGVDQVVARLRRHSKAPRVLILGGSHSAISAATALLQHDLGWQAGSLQVLSRRTPKLFYPSAAAAQVDGYADFSSQDICPVTGKVFRLAGLRMASRELVRRVFGMAEPREERVHLALLSKISDAALGELLDQADLVIPAFGYRPRTLPVFDGMGRRVPLLAEQSPISPLVNDACQVLGADQRPIDGLYGMGLASGFVPRGKDLGGEPSFVGQTNGLWLYQHDLGDLLRQALMAYNPQTISNVVEQLKTLSSDTTQAAVFPPGVLSSG